MEEYKQRLKEIYPEYTDKEIDELLELTIDFWKWLIENFDLFFNNYSNESNHIL